VADDDLWSAELEKPLEPVVAVDHAAVEVVEVAGGKTATIELDHRPQIGRKDGQHAKNHPGRLVAGLPESFEDAKALGGLLALLAASRLHFDLKLGPQLLCVQAIKD